MKANQVILYIKTNRLPTLMMNMTNKKIISFFYLSTASIVFYGCFLFFLLFQQAHAAPFIQTDSPKNKGEQQQALTLIKSIYAQFQDLPTDNGRLDSVVSIFTKPCDVPSSESFLSKAAREDANSYNRDLGLGLGGQISTRSTTNNSNNTNTTVDSNGFDVPQGYVQLTFDVLHDGYLENKNKAQALYREADLIELREKNKKIADDYLCRRYKLTQLFSGVESRILTLRLALLEEIYAIERRAYFKGWSRYDELLVSEDELVQIRHDIDSINNVLPGNRLSEPLNPPLVDIKFKLITDAIEGSQSEQTKIQKEMLTYKEDAKGNTRLRFFLRKEVNNGTSGNPGSVGVSFAMPMTLNTGDSLKYQLLAVDKNEEFLNWEMSKRVSYAYDQLRYQQKQTISKRYQYQRALERFHSSLISANLDGDETVIVASLTRLNTLLDTAFSLMEAKKELYQKLNEVFLQAQVEFKPEFITLYRLPTEENRSRLWDRSLYVWSESFNKFNNENMFDFLKRKNINDVIISYSKKINKEKFSSFLNLSKNQHLHVEIMVGDNNWVFPEHHKDAARAVALVAAKNQSVHLDIEPQAFRDFKERKQEYVDNYIDMLKSIRAEIGNKRLTVALPLHFPISSYGQISNLVDGVYLMAYDGKEGASERRLKPIIQTMQDVDHVTVVLRIKDFSDEWALEQRMEKLNETLNIKHFGFENFDTFLKLTSQPR